MKYLDILDQFSSKRVLVLGDSIMDIYLKGCSTRLSPEAPVPVVDVVETVRSPGGAANVALNLQALNAQVCFLSVIGNDVEGNNMQDFLTNHGIDTQGVIRHSWRKTIVKTRVVAGTQVAIRFDQGTDSAIDSETEQTLIDLLQIKAHAVDAILVSDYNKGIITQRIVKVLETLSRERGLFIGVDSKRLPFFSELRPALVKPNYDEVIGLLDAERLTAARVEQLEARGQEIFAKTKARITAVTLDTEGSLIFSNDTFVCHTTAPTVASPSVAGAGDTFISAFILAVIAGASLDDATQIATAAAHVVVSKDTTAWCMLKELKCHFYLKEKFISDITDLEDLCDLYHFQGKRIVFTNGCFDILHSGHVSYLNKAKTLGDILIVGVNRDDSIRRLKGNNRPINPLHDRLQVLAGLSAVDHIIPFGAHDDDTPTPLISRVKPHIFVKGGDYRKGTLPEADTIERCGGKIVFLPFVPDHSTTEIINRIHNNMGSTVHN